MKTSEKLINILKEKNLKLITVESCTGGLIGKKLTDVAGASEVYLGGLITYSNELKKVLCNVKDETLESYGAVSRGVAIEMAEGALKNHNADIAISVTGVAGPGYSEDKPAGLVYIGIATKQKCDAKRFNFAGNRKDVRKASSKTAIELVINAVEQM